MAFSFGGQKAHMSLDIVQAVKAAFEAQGVDLSGACGAFTITNEVARRVGFFLLRKGGGNRAVPQQDGSCQDGDHSNQPGYATDYIIDPATFFGYDILGDGGGANNPQWGEPETDAEMVQRNRNNFAPPIGPVVGPPVPADPPDPPDPPEPPQDPALNERLQRIEENVGILLASIPEFLQVASHLEASIEALKSASLHLEGSVRVFGQAAPITLDKK